jgi:hypothetical protein
MLQKRLSLAIDEGLMDLQEIDWAEQHRLLASEFGETGGGELDGLPALQDRFDQPRARSSRSDRAAPAPSVPSPDAPPAPAVSRSAASSAVWRFPPGHCRQTV